MSKVIISEFMDEKALENFPNHYDVHYDPNLVDQPSELVSLLQDADALIVRNRTQVNNKLLMAAPRLKAVGRLGVGLDNIDLEACERRSIPVLPATGANSNSVAEYVIGTMMALTRSAYQASDTLDKMRDGKWPRNALIGGEVSGKSLGLVGFGAIAQMVAVKASALGMSIIAFDPYLPNADPAWQNAQRMELDELLATADCISLHVPLTDGTRHLINQAALSRMKKSSILINTARGGVVDDRALAMALKAGDLAGAALDVFETEPMTAASGTLFDKLNNVILTPHIAGITEEGNVRVSSLTVQNVLRVLEDQS